MAKKTVFVRVKWVKKHWDYAYLTGSIGTVDADKVPALLKDGFLIPLPDEDEEKVLNPLPEELPGRDKLFKAGFTSVEDIKKAGESISDVLNKTEAKNLKGYLEEGE
jgi:hypothetical protein